MLLMRIMMLILRPERGRFEPDAKPAREGAWLGPGGTRRGLDGPEPGAGGGPALGARRL